MNKEIKNPNIIKIIKEEVVFPIDNKYRNEKIELKLKNLDDYNKEFKKEFLSSPREYYTINVASLRDVSKVEKFLDYYNISDKAFLFTVGENKDKIKVMYGSYSTREEVLDALSKLSSDLIKSNNPYIEKIHRKQDLYKEYHKNSEELKVKERIVYEAVNINDVITSNISETYSIYLDTVSKNKVKWFADRYSININDLKREKNNGRINLYIGSFKSNEDALLFKSSLHPRLNKSKIIFTGDK